MRSREDVQDFIVLEARLMDESRYEEWLSLWTDTGVYWVPCNADDIDPTRQVSIIYDDRIRLGQRVDRLKSGSVLAHAPVPRMRRIVSNVEIAREPDGTLAVASNFMLGFARMGTQQLWIGRTLHTLVEHGGALKIQRKKVLLIDNDQEIPLLQFLI